MDLHEKGLITYHFEVNGLPTEAVFDRRTLTETVDPFLAEIREGLKTQDRRMIVFMAAPPGAGKSTLGKLVEIRSEGLLQCISIDGFHYRNETLARMKVRRPEGEVSASSVKGSPETFDVEKLRQNLLKARTEEACSFPVYDRSIHEPVEDGILLESPVLLLEGNWLLYPENGWEKLKELADLTIFLDAEEEDLKAGLVERKIRGGLTREAAEAWFLNTDGPNIRKVKEHRTEADLQWHRVFEGLIIKEDQGG